MQPNPTAESMIPVTSDSTRDSLIYDPFLPFTLGTALNTHMSNSVFALMFNNDVTMYATVLSLNLITLRYLWFGGTCYPLYVVARWNPTYQRVVALSLDRCVLLPHLEGPGQSA